jgi:hypothetical protein
MLPFLPKRTKAPRGKATAAVTVCKRLMKADIFVGGGLRRNKGLEV